MYRVLSPDGFDIEMDSDYRTFEEATAARAAFVERYRSQGYYSTGNHEHIALSDIADRCTIVHPSV